MTSGNEIMSAMKWLATLGLVLLLPAAHATTAVVFSESTGRWGVAWNEPGKDGAIKKATEDCRYRGGGKDCKPIKVSDEPGFGAVAQTCAGGYCGISIITGRRSAADAERDVVSDCNKHYGVNNCYALDRWQETAAAPAPVAKAPPPSPAPSESSETQEDNQNTREMQIAEVACNKGNAKSCFDLGKHYDNMKDSPREKTAQFYVKACNFGHAEGCYLTGLKYNFGLGVPVDPEQATKILDKACNMGSSGACQALANMYIRGRGVPTNYMKAAQLYSKACSMGEGIGCSALGDSYSKGLGVPRDQDKAVQFHDKACKMGVSRSCNASKTGTDHE